METMKATTFESIIGDQIDRIGRNNLKKGDNAILDFINDINDEISNSRLGDSK